MHEEALTDKGRELFPKLARFKGFYLVGGTALAIQIGHRRSVDFDMFTEEELPSRILQSVKRIFSDSSVQVTYQVPGQTNVLIDDIKTTFLEYPYPVLDPLVEYQGVPMASIREIAAMKGFSIGKRLSYKDYVDWYFVLSEKRVALDEVIDLAQRKYGGDFNDRLFLSQLASFGDIHTQKIDFLRGEVNRETIQSCLEEEVKGYKL